MTGFPAKLKDRIRRLEETHSLRFLRLRSGVDFSSNDYLGFADDAPLKQRILDGMIGHRKVGREQLPVGSSGSRLLRGHLNEFEQAENVLAEFCSRESAVIFPSGYQANIGLLSAILQPDDVVFSDQLNHASLIDGIRLSGAKKIIYSHCNLDDLRNRLEQNTQLQTQTNSCGLKVIVTESLFGMDGDTAPLRELVELAEEFSALLVVDEAHATGLWGDFQSNLGGGLVQSLGLSHRVFATIHPGGKSMGVGGAWVCGDSELKELMINFSRAFIFSTAPMPILPLALQLSAKYWQEVGAERAREVLAKAHDLRQGLIDSLSSYPATQDLDLGRLHQISGPITPVILKDNSLALGFAHFLQEQGFDIRAIRPPTVPENAARLRLTSNWRQTGSDMDRLCQVISMAMSSDSIKRPEQIKKLGKPEKLGKPGKTEKPEKSGKLETAESENVL